VALIFKIKNSVWHQFVKEEFAVKKFLPLIFAAEKVYFLIYNYWNKTIGKLRKQARQRARQSGGSQRAVEWGRSDRSALYLIVEDIILYNFANVKVN